MLGQTIILVAAARSPVTLDSDTLIAERKKRLPKIMILALTKRYPGSPPRNCNGRIERKLPPQPLPDSFEG